MNAAGDPGFAHAGWTRASNVYEVNLRQFTPEGTLRAFEAHLPRLQALGVDIVWLMPVQPSGVLHRKGSLGSPYAVRDHCAVHPDYGTLEDFRRVVRAAHALGLRVIIDWVANHTAWDHRWVAEHPQRYRRNQAGEIHAYAYDNGRELEYWTDVVGLDWTRPEVGAAMGDAMEWWLRETDIDGFRCDVAGLVPLDFWERTRERLERLKPVYLLAEGDDPAMHRRAFDATYDWGLHDRMRDVAQGRSGASVIADYFDTPPRAYPADAYRLIFTTNHDKNAWEGHDLEVFSESFKVFAMLAVTLPGQPLIYGGQEAVLDRRLAFFEKDPIEWRDCPLAAFYAALLQSKHEHPALWNGAAGGAFERLPATNEHVLAFRRVRDDDSVTVVANLSAKAQTVVPAEGGAPRLLEPWGWSIATG